MGWVTLTLRKRELKQEHAYYQLRDLQISRAKRQLARSKTAKISETQTKQQQELQDPKTAYTAAQQTYQQTMRSLYSNSGDSSSTTDATNKQAQMNEAQSVLQQAQLDYQNKVDSIKTYYENEKAMIEEEAADAETELDMEQVEVEAQMEAISAEIQAVSDAISSEIQASTIKLA